MTRHTVTNKGPIDWHEPGADVTGLYDADTLQRLIDDGYVMADMTDAHDDDEPAGVDVADIEDDEDEDGE